MNEPVPLSPVELLILTRLVSVGENGETTAKIQKDLEPILGHRWSGSVLTSQLDRMLIKLVSKGLVAHRPAKSKKAAPSVELTADGRQAILGFFHVNQLPTKPKQTWAKLKHSFLIAPALGLPGPGGALAKDDTFRAVLLKSQYKLPLGDYPTLKQAKAEWLRKTLGMGEKEKLTLETVQASLLSRELGDGRPPDPKRVVDRLLAKRLKARKDNAKELRDEVLRNWIDSSLGMTTTGESPPPAHSLDLPHFAGRVLAAARACPTGRFGDTKVFIVHVWRAIQGDEDLRGMDFSSFKQRLAEANNARLLDLSRADLVQAMDPDDVRLSEVCYFNATFHFIRIEPERP
jgi:hypothetical protein